MKHIVMYGALVFILLSCKTEKKEESSKQKSPSEIETSKIGQNNYAVTWKWKTNDVQLVSDNLTKISNELTALWNNKIVENAYYNHNPKINKLGHLPNISFFLKAKSQEEAKKILDNLTIVGKNLATYELHPVGQLWLKRKFKTIHENGMTQSFVTIWTTNSKPSDELAKAQSDKLLQLYEQGRIENAYFDIQGTQTANNKTDFVFYVNSNSEKEAKELCDTLPFSIEKIATYKMFPVGVFWMGEYNNN